MLWLIQRDFLEGKTVQSMVSEALQPVPNPYQDQDIAQVQPCSVHSSIAPPPLFPTQLLSLSVYWLEPRGSLGKLRAFEYS